MLVNLHVKNLALIREEDITFDEGLHILSGETGAGKSIILGALGLALGGRISREMLRDNQKEGFVEVVFRVTSDHQRKQLQALDLEAYDDEVIVSRRISETRSVARINGETVPAMKLKQVGSIFLDIHGQQEHQSLSKKQKHLELLDASAKELIQPRKLAVKEAYRLYTDRQKEWDSSNMDEAQRLREISFLQHEIAEIEGAGLVPGEDEELEKKYRKLSNGRKIMESLSAAYQNSAGSDGASELLDRALREFHGILGLDEPIDEMQQMLNDIDGLLNDFNRMLSLYMDEAEFDAAAFAETEQRLNEINRLKDKYGRSIEEILEALGQKQERLSRLESYEQYLAKLQKQVSESRQQLEEYSAQLSAQRQQAAGELCQRVQQALLDLNFLDVAFSMDFHRLDHYSAEGYDDAEFMIRTNPGEPLRPLKDIASGGEMSRIMLAIKTVLAQRDGIDTLIFDEIDAGISGRTAQAVSEKLSLVAADHQVICITHLPQIAAMADQHYLIEKAVVGDETVSSIRKLSYEDSVKELARMLGGSSITQAVLDNAKEMKEMARCSKQKK
jgi:DNA repair protein RecN (Recombination protein N)